MTFDFPDNLFSKLDKVIKRTTKDIEYIASGGMAINQDYKKIINEFDQKLKIGLDTNSLTIREVMFISNELAINRRYLEQLLITEGEFEIFITILWKYEKLSIYKNIIKMYFNHFNLLSANLKHLNQLNSYIKSILNKYNGKNKLLNNCKKDREYLFNPIDLLEKNNHNINEIKNQFNLLDNYQYVLTMLNYKLIEKIKKLHYDFEDTDLFIEIKEKQNLIFKDGYNLKEFVAKELLTKVIDKKQAFPNWKKFIIELIGDPRSYSRHNSNTSSWNVIGDKLKTYFIGTLSKEDLKLFLEQLSENDIQNYEYRKAFWMAFADNVTYAKLMVGREARALLPLEIKRKISQDDTSYATYNKNEQSAIYIDFGEIKIIEFTHSGKVRGYKECPINLNKHRYTHDELITYKHNLFEEAHLSPPTYNWQKKVLRHMNRYLGTNVQVEDIKIQQDKDKYDRYVNPYSIPKAGSNENTKTCKLCGQTKQKEQFYNSKRKEYGYGSYCRKCVEKQRNKR